jgi:hypothetical protein
VRRQRIFRIFTTTVAGALAVLLVFGALHRSASPIVLHRYSEGYALVLAVLALAFMTAAWAAWKLPPRLVTVLANGYLVAASLAISLLLLESGLRIVNPWGMELFHWLPYHMQGMVDHPQLGYVHPRSVSYRLGSNVVTLNSNGLRDKEIAYDKPAGEKRVLLLGDSVTFGWGVSDGETFSDRMEPQLRSLTGIRWEVINAGVNGYNTQQEETYLRMEGIRYQPEIVVLLYNPNDVEPIIDPNATTWRRHPTWPSSLPEVFNRLRQMSYLYQATRLLAQADGGNPRTDAADVGVTLDPRWGTSKRHLQRIAALCAERQVHLLVARLDDSDVGFFSELAQLGIPTVPLGEAWVQVPKHEHRISRLDPHPSAKVHRSIADLLVRALSDRGLLH